MVDVGFRLPIQYNKSLQQTRQHKDASFLAEKIQSYPAPQTYKPPVMSVCEIAHKFVFWNPVEYFIMCT